MIIAIDGPAASGKSTTAKLVAKKLNITYLDTGAMYRAVTLQLLRSNTNFDNIDKVSSILGNLNIDMYDYKGRDIIKLNNEDGTEEIRSSNVTKYVSEVSALLTVRKTMVIMQREIGFRTDCVIEGRDIGTKVFPKADYKFYLIANINIRVSRRFAQYSKNNVIIDKEEIKKMIIKRDNNDRNRKYCPLIKASDSIVVDTSKLSIKEQVDYIYNKVK